MKVILIFATTGVSSMPLTGNTLATANYNANFSSEGDYDSEKSQQDAAWNAYMNSYTYVYLNLVYDDEGNVIRQIDYDSLVKALMPDVSQRAKNNSFVENATP